jgi:hypothetical protein
MRGQSISLTGYEIGLATQNNSLRPALRLGVPTRRYRAYIVYKANQTTGTSVHRDPARSLS